MEDGISINMCVYVFYIWNWFNKHIILFLYLLFIIYVTVKVEYYLFCLNKLSLSQFIKNLKTLVLNITL